MSVLITDKSPVFSHMTNTLHGLSTIRAYKAQEQFELQFDSIQNIHSTVNFSQILAARWFGSVAQILTFAYFSLVTLGYMLSSAGKLKCTCRYKNGQTLLAHYTNWQYINGSTFNSAPSIQKQY